MYEDDECDQPHPEDCCCCKVKLVSQDYQVLKDDCYIGVNSDGPVTITLPELVGSCQKYIIKLEHGPPIGPRKATIVGQGGTTIDGNLTYVLQQPYETITVIGTNNWYII